MSGALPLPARIDATTAADVYAALIQRAGDPLDLDASEVTGLSTQAIQVLLSAARTWREAGIPLSITAPSEAFIEHLKMVGLSPVDFVSPRPETAQ